MKHIVILLALTLTLASCMTQKRMARICAKCTSKVEVRDSIHEVVNTVVKDSLIQLPADSAWYKLWLECDSSGRVQVKHSETKQGNKAQTNYTLKDNVLRSDCKVDSQSVAIQWLEQHKEYERIRTEERIVKECIPIKLSKWQTFLLNLGKGLFWLVVVAAIGGILWVVWKIWKPLKFL